MNPNNPTFRPYRNYWLDVGDVKVYVSYYSPPRPMHITGTGFGDAEPPEPEEMEYEVFDEAGAPLFEDSLSEREIEIIEDTIRFVENDGDY